MAQKPSIPKGTRDFSAVEVAKRQYIMGIIKHHFECFGYLPIETPSFENSETLIGKYGEEGDRLIFKILNSGDYLSKVSPEILAQNNSQKLTPLVSEKALRYDLTVPFARYVVQHQNDIVFPFKRFQMQPVWRADRPQKGRFREFYQCDADVVGSDSLWQEVELIKLYDAVFCDLGLEGVVIKINNRKILAGIAEVIGAADKLIDFTVALDKLDKIGAESVRQEMLDKGILDESIQKAQVLFELKGSIFEKIELLSHLLAHSKEGLKGIEELQFICNNISKLGLKNAVLDLDVTLARGLNYYTGAIFEVASPPSVAMGSIGGGGRYDDLTGIFGLKNMSGVGISFGLDRIYLVLEALDLFSKTVLPTTELLFLNQGKDHEFASMMAVSKLRDAGLKVEFYPDDTKIGKQYLYAEKRQIAYVATINTLHNEPQTYTLKRLDTGESQQLTLEKLKEEIGFLDKI